MKKLSTLFFLLFTFFISTNSHAQIPDGTTAPDWTATDLDGVTWNMYDMLNSGKHVVLEFSATWCGPCWNFHSTGTLETLHDTYGPNGTDQIRVFYIEADLNTNTDCLYNLPGCNSSTQGDWVTGHDFPFIDLTSTNGAGMGQDYQIGYYPTIYAVSANGTNGVYEVGQETNIQNWASWFFESFEMSVNPTVTPADCPGEGAIQLAVNNGAGSLDYAWSNGAGNTDYIDGLEPGFFTVTITDDNGYELIEQIEVTGPSDGPLGVDLLASQDVGCNGDASGALNIEAYGGNGGYSYQWSNGATGTYLDALPAGSYSVVVTDAAGCTSEDVYNVTEPPVLTLTTLPEDADCGEENGAVVAVAIGGSSPWQYDFGFGANYSGVFNDVAPGDYVMSVTDGNGCFETMPFTVESTDGPTAAADVDGDLDCMITEVTVSGQGSDEGDDISYEWTTDDGTIVEGADQLDAVVSAAGVYTLTVTNSITGCSETAEVTVTSVASAPISMVEDPAVITCAVEEITIDATGSDEGDNISYEWTTDDGTIVEGADGIMPVVSAAGTYTLTITNADNGCTSETDVVVSEDVATPDVMVSTAELDCSTTEVEICADVADDVMVIWSTTDGDVEGTCIMVSAAGFYDLVATAPNGCATEAQAEVTISDDLPQVSIPQPDAITCTVETSVITADLEGDLEDYTIEWMDADGNIINAEDLSIEVDAAGDYTLTVTNIANGCTTVSSVNVDEIIIEPVAGFTFEVIDGVITVNSASEGDPNSYSWSNGEDGESTSIMYDENGTYEICLTVVNDCGEDTYCEEVAYAIALIYEAAVEAALCYAEPTGTISVEPAGGMPEYSISWTGPNGFTSTDFELSNLEAGTYSMELSDDFGYVKSEDFVVADGIEIIEDLVEISDETNMDANGSITVEYMGGVGPYTYLWNNGETSAAITDLSAGEYTVVVTDANGCEKTFGPYVVNSVTGVADVSFLNEMNIYPIPAVNYLTVEIELTEALATQMKIIDSFGKLIETRQFNAKSINTKIDVSQMQSGVYFLEFGNSTSKTLERFVVIK